METLRAPFVQQSCSKADVVADALDANAEEEVLQHDEAGGGGHHAEVTGTSSAPCRCSAVATSIVRGTPVACMVNRCQ